MKIIDWNSGLGFLRLAWVIVLSRQALEISREVVNLREKRFVAECLGNKREHNNASVEVVPEVGAVFTN